MTKPDGQSSATDALDDLIAATGANRDVDSASRADRRRRWERSIGWALLVVSMSGFLIEVVASSALVADSGPRALAIVWPIGGAITLILAVLQSRFVDRLARIPVIMAVGGAITIALVTSLVLWVATDSLVLSAAVASIAADQLNFLLPLIIWSLAGDIFTAGQATSVFPRLARWVLIGHVSGLALATFSPLAFERVSASNGWVLVIPLILLTSAGVSLHRHLNDATTSSGHRRSEGIRRTIAGSIEFIRSLPAFRWIFWTSLLAITAGTMLEFNLLDALQRRFADAGDLQVAFAATALAGFLLRWLLSDFVVSKILRTQGVARSLSLLPISTILGAAFAIIGGITHSWLLVVAGVLIWRYARWGVDLAARQTAMANLPDERRAGVTLLTDLFPQSVGLLMTPLALALVLAVDEGWLLGGVASLSGLAALACARAVARSWDDTQLSYRLKRRKRIT